MSAGAWQRVVYPLLGIVLLIAGWHWYVVQFSVPVVVLPSPAQVLNAALRERNALVTHGIITLKESVYGFALAFLLGVPIAVAVSQSRLLNLTFSPLLVAMQSVPKVALAPIVLVWAGTGIESKLVIALLVAFFPIVVDTVAGMRATPREFLELAQSLRASRWQILTKVQFPSAVPFVIAGSKVAVTLAVIGAVIGEFVGSSEGLGNLLLVANSQLDTPLAFAALFALAILGIALYGAVALLEYGLDLWSGETPLTH